MSSLRVDSLILAVAGAVTGLTSGGGVWGGVSKVVDGLAGKIGLEGKLGRRPAQRSEAILAWISENGNGTIW
jgi:hypothetical protein